ncbi:MAG: ROK family protein [Patescibacteria group bacterium]
MYIVFDVGGTKMRLGSSRDGETLDKAVVVKTPTSYEEGIAELKKNASALSEGEAIDALAGGLAGAFSQKKLSLVSGPNLKDWVGRPICSELETFFNAPAYVENDAALAGLGEALRGAGRGFEIVAYITVSTGIGGVRIVQGRIDAKSIGFEPGHQIIDADRTMIPDADGILWGDYISGRGLAKRTGHDPKEFKESAFWDGLAKILAYGLNNVCVFWSPDVIVLGGSMITGDPAIPVEKTREYLRSITKVYPELPVIKISELGDSCGLHGALEYLRTKGL